MTNTAGARYAVDPVATFLDANAERYVADGIPLPELFRARSRVSHWDQWWPYWMERSEWFEAHAEAGGDHTEPTRSSLMVLSTLCAHLAQYLHFHAPDQRRLALQRKVELYRRLAPSLLPPARPVSVPYAGHDLPGFVRTPADAGSPAPCVVYVGGLDAHKEDAHGFIELCLERGCAVLAFDGPGQGEAILQGVLLTEEAYTAVGAAVDVAASFPGIDGNRVGVIGRSLGGFLAPRAAAEHDGIRALAVWGAMYDLGNFAELPPHTKAGFQHITGAATEQEAAEELAFVSMSGQAGRITCPTLIVHGGGDRLTPPETAIRMAEEIGDHARLELYADSPHCNHDLAHIVRPLLADWLARQLG